MVAITVLVMETTSLVRVKHAVRLVRSSGWYGPVVGTIQWLVCSSGRGLALKRSSGTAQESFWFMHVFHISDV